MRFELVDKEHAKGVIGGSDYGSSVRIMARSPTHVMFNALGSILWTRGLEGWRNERRLFRDRATREKFERPEVQATIEEVFGEGSGVAVLDAWRLGKTLLVDGGGEKLIEPGLLLRKKAEALYAAKSCSASVDLAGRVPTCLQCGKDLVPHTKNHHMGKTILPDHPRSIEDCQRLTNRTVVAVHSYDTRYPDRLGFVEWFESWDDETTRDPHFCNDACAAKYGRRAAEAYAPLEPGIEPVKHDRPHESANHYTEEVRHLTLRDGSKLRI